MKTYLDKIIQRAVAIQQIPAPTFQEENRAQWVAAQFKEEKLDEVSTDQQGNVYAVLRGHSKKQAYPPLVISAHTDTVFPLGTDLSITREPKRIFGPGIGDNSLAVAGLFGIVWAIREKKIRHKGDIWLAANTAEEGLGDLKGMRAVVERFGDTPVAYLILEGMALGQVYHRALGVRRYKISAHTQGGHSWVHYGRPSAIHALTRLTGRLLDIPIPEKPATSRNVGIIEGGTSINTIAPYAAMQLDLRSESPDMLKSLVEQVEYVVRNSAPVDVRFDIEIIGDRPAGELPANHPLIELAIRSLEAQGIEPKLNIGSTDANIPLSMGLPAVCVGLTKGGGAHTIEEFIETDPLEKGMQQVLRMIEGVWGE